MILVCGEALIDLVADGDLLDEEQPPRFTARPGGSPANVAVALGRLGTPVSFLGRVSRDRLGVLLTRHLTASAVDVSLVASTDDPTTLVVVTTDRSGEPTFDFHIAGTASATITPADVVRPLPDDIFAVVVGSISVAMEPTASTLEALMADEADRRVIVFDPNVRPPLVADPDGYRARIERWVAASDIVKVSAADLAWLEPGTDPLDVATRWRAAGPELVVVTSGVGGAVGVTAGGSIRVDSPAVRVVDTVGAGDAFTAGLLHFLAREGHLRPGRLQFDAEVVEGALRFACAVAADTCTRPGADPPWAGSAALRAHA
jgi:fructokinase